ncbi:phosphoribosylpyrophosphate synthetase [Thalassobaculum fulvum]|uniref:ribose-phosphate diphosphokinase n=1 Tax=Thalassobaculum fulvum TaxID=1633335 RepID=A0A918XWD4_9PROT|nr:ribose-phosphate pyrophosphokinase [Thalassobaculum fulvum]GHD60517.1 phosphoribosylpyrophosphate synthetase [Thalassobaculum fulvum]
MRPLVLPLPGNEDLAADLTARLGAEAGALQVRRFPDGETYVRLLTEVAGRQVVLVCTLDRPDDRLLPLVFAAATARELGAERVGLVCPYLGYMRQDKRFQPGEAISSAIFARLLDPWIDWLVTVDPHLHRRSSLSEIYAAPADVLHAAPAIAAWIRREVPRPLLVGPDSESEQWVSAVARDAAASYVVLEKTRRGDRDVEVSVPEVVRWRDHTPVLVDDIVSTGRTMIETIGHLRRAGLAAPVCIGVHAVFAGDAFREIAAAGAGRTVTCNSIRHPSNAIDLGPLLADAVRSRLASGQSPKRPSRP